MDANATIWYLKPHDASLPPYTRFFVLFLLRQVLWRSLLVVTFVAILKAGRDLSKEACALVWRQNLVSFLHLWYLRGKTPYVLSTGEAGRNKLGGGGAYMNR